MTAESSFLILGSLSRKCNFISCARILSLCSLAALFSFSPVDAAVIEALSCSQADVTKAIDSTRSGDTVRIPPGTCTWGDKGSYISLTKAITLRGSGRGSTIIELSPTAGAWTSGTVRISAAATVRDLTIRTDTSGNSGTAFSASANGFRITNIEYINRTVSVNGYFLYSGAYGLVDNCSITGSSGSNELIFVRGPLDSWQTPSSMGGSANFFVENCEFNGAGYVIDCNSNGRCVVRYNTINGQMKIDGHGKASNTPPRGVRHMEIYNNHWTAKAGYYTTIELRGGTARIFNNVSDTTQTTWQFREYAATNTWPNFNNRCQCPGDYPIDDQIGVGMDPKSPASEPVYAWNNTELGNQITWARGDWLLDGKNVCQTDAQCGPDYTAITQISQDRDYYTSAVKPAAMSNYHPYICPHPLVGDGVCLENVSGRSGYKASAEVTVAAPSNLRVAGEN